MRWALATGVLLAVLTAGCAESHARGERSGAAARDHDADSAAADGGSSAPPFPVPVSEPAASGCQGCTIPLEAEFYMAHSCCSENQRCGLSFPEFGYPQCLEQNSPGTRDPGCPDFAVTLEQNALGCCRVDGLCGAMDPLLDLGCVRLPFLPAMPCDASTVQRGLL